MADGVHAPVDPVQLPSLQPSLEPPRPDPRVENLSAGDHAMLPSRQLSEQLVGIGAFSLHTGV